MVFLLYSDTNLASCTFTFFPLLCFIIITTMLMHKLFHKLIIFASVVFTVSDKSCFTLYTYHYHVKSQQILQTVPIQWSDTLIVFLYLVGVLLRYSYLLFSVFQNWILFLLFCYFLVVFNSALLLKLYALHSLFPKISW